MLGSLPNELALLTGLIEIRMQRNDFTSSLPSYISQLTNLKTLQLFENALQGNIPASIGALNELITVDLSSNALSGQLPNGLFENWSELQILDLGQNNLTGRIPLKNTTGQTSESARQLQSSSFLESIRQLLLDNNEFDGPIPTELGSLVSLEHLNLQNVSILYPRSAVDSSERLCSAFSHQLQSPPFS